jgi:multidrug transporter EmrE-like cation transporter
MNAPWLALIALLCNAGAQLSMKYAGGETRAENGWAMLLSPWTLMALSLYGLSFLVVIRVYAVNPLSVAAPILTGGTFLLITLASWLLLGENIGLQKIAGIGLIFAGIVVLARG